MQSMSVTELCKQGEEHAHYCCKGITHGVPFTLGHSLLPVRIRISVLYRLPSAAVTVSVVLHCVHGDVSAKTVSNLFR